MGPDPFLPRTSVPLPYYLYLLLLHQAHPHLAPLHSHSHSRSLGLFTLSLLHTTYDSLLQSYLLPSRLTYLQFSLALVAYDRYLFNFIPTIDCLTCNPYFLCIRLLSASPPTAFQTTLHIVLRIHALCNRFPISLLCKCDIPLHLAWASGHLLRSLCIRQPTH